MHARKLWFSLVQQPSTTCGTYTALLVNRLATLATYQLECSLRYDLLLPECYYLLLHNYYYYYYGYYYYYNDILLASVAHREHYYYYIMIIIMCVLLLLYIMYKRMYILSINRYTRDHKYCKTNFYKIQRTRTTYSTVIHVKM